MERMVNPEQLADVSISVMLDGGAEAQKAEACCLSWGLGAVPAEKV